jgi:hypothetical protein
MYDEEREDISPLLHPQVVAICPTAPQVCGQHSLVPTAVMMIEMKMMTVLELH